MSSHSLNYTFTSCKVRFRDTTSAGPDNGWVLEVGFNMTLNPGNVDGDGSMVDTVIPGVIEVPAVSNAASNLGLAYATAVSRMEAIGALTLLRVHQSDYQYDWPGEGQAGSSSSTNTLMSGAGIGAPGYYATSITYPGTLP